MAKSKSTATNLSSHVPTSSSSAKSLIASQSLGILTATEKPESRIRRNSKSDAASSSQARQQDAYLGGLVDTAKEKPVATKEESGDVSPATIRHTEAVFSIVRGIYGREHDDPMDDLEVNMAIGGIFLNATLPAAVDLGRACEANLRYVKNDLWNSVGQLFLETGKLISEQEEITGFSTVGFKDATWMSTSLLCEEVYQITNAKTYVFSVSVLCVGKMGDDPTATRKSKMKWC